MTDPHFPTQSDLDAIWLDPVPHDPAPTLATRIIIAARDMSDRTAIALSILIAIVGALAIGSIR